MLSNVCRSTGGNFARKDSGMNFYIAGVATDIVMVPRQVNRHLAERVVVHICGFPHSGVPVGFQIDNDGCRIVCGALSFRCGAICGELLCGRK